MSTLKGKTALVTGSTSGIGLGMAIGLAKQVDARAEREGISNDAAKQALVSEKQPSGEFVTPEHLAALAVFLCGPDASEVRGVAWNMDGGWVAQ
jgi:3-hydroxybutyrate dehydrogenase